MQVKVRLNDLRQTSNRANELNVEVKSLFDRTTNNLKEICRIVQCSELTSATNSINEEIETINNEINESLREINNFLIEQINYYSISNENATSAINKLSEQITNSFSTGGGN